MKTLPNHHFNPIGHLVELAKCKNPEVIDKAREIALILCPEPPTASGDGVFFRQQARDWITWWLVYLAWWESITGELVCNLPALYERVFDGLAEIEGFLAEMRCCTVFEGTVRKAANRILGRFARASKTAESILSECQNALQIYDPASKLAQSMVLSEFSPSDLKNPDTPTTVFIVIPSEKAGTHGTWAGLCLNTLVDAGISSNRFNPRITIVGDEWANISQSPLPSVRVLLSIGRSRGVQLVSFVQDSESYKMYGPDASLFTTQAEVVVAWNVRSLSDAKEYSERSGMRGEMIESTNLSLGAEQNSEDKYSLGLSEKGLPLLRPDEIMQLPPFTAIVFHRQDIPFLIDLVSYRMVEPWHAQADLVPGTPPLNELPVIYKT